MVTNERLIELFNFLKSNNIVYNQQDFVKRISSDKATISQILNKKIKIPNILFKKIRESFPFISDKWLLTGEGEMLITPIHQSILGDNNTQITGSNNRTSPLANTLDKAINEIAEQRKLVAKSQEQIDRLISLLEKK